MMYCGYILIKDANHSYSKPETDKASPTFFLVVYFVIECYFLQSTVFYLSVIMSSDCWLSVIGPNFAWRSVRPNQHYVTWTDPHSITSRSLVEQQESHFFCGTLEDVLLELPSGRPMV